MREVSIYLVSGIPSMQRKSGYVAYCLEYYSPGSKYPVTLTNVEEVEEMTGRHAELIVLLKALKRLNEKCILSIYTESEYLDMGIGERRLVDKWQKNDWKDGKMLPIKKCRGMASHFEKTKRESLSGTFKRTKCICRNVARESENEGRN